MLILIFVDKALVFGNNFLKELLRVWSPKPRNPSIFSLLFLLFMRCVILLGTDSELSYTLISNSTCSTRPSRESKHILVHHPKPVKVAAINGKPRVVQRYLSRECKLCFHCLLIFLSQYNYLLELTCLLFHTLLKTTPFILAFFQTNSSSSHLFSRVVVNSQRQCEQQRNLHPVTVQRSEPAAGRRGY